MKDNKEIDKIRELISRWYSGESTPAEEHELQDLLSSNIPLPPDLAAERTFFAALSESAMNLPELPSEYAERISDVLEKEIAGSKVEVRNPSAFRSARKRRWMWAAAGVAVCLMGSFITFRMLDDSELDGRKNMNVAVKIPAPNAADDTIQMHGLTFAPEPASDNIAAANGVNKKNIIRKRSQRDKKKVASRREETSFEGWEDYGNDSEMQYSSSEEEALLASGNYRVVRSDEEAQAIINSIFGRMDSQLAMESGRLSLIESDYSSEIEEISNKYNATTSNEEYHEYTPI